MKTILILLFTVSISSIKADEKSADEKFDEKLSEAQTAYRKDIAAEYLKADKVTIHLVDSGFWRAEDVTKREDFIPLLLRETFSKVLESKTLDAGEREKFLALFSGLAAKDDNISGLLCHYPFHAVRIYSKDKLIYEGTFCWECQNFAFRYPTGSDYLSTSKELQAFLNAVLPDPEKPKPAPIHK